LTSDQFPAILNLLFGRNPQALQSTLSRGSPHPRRACLLPVPFAVTEANLLMDSIALYIDPVHSDPHQVQAANNLVSLLSMTNAVSFFELSVQVNT
jgi:hypothetical protein